MHSASAAAWLRWNRPRKRPKTCSRLVRSHKRRIHFKLTHDFYTISFGIKIAMSKINELILDKAMYDKMILIKVW